MRRTLSPNQIADKCAERREAQKFAFARAMHDCLWGIAGAAVDALGATAYKLRTVESWMNFADPQRGPGQVLAVCMRVSLAQGRDESEALAPLEQLAGEFGRRTVPLSGVGSSATLLASLASVAKEIGEAESATLKALDGGIDEFEARKVLKEIREAKEAIFRLESGVEAILKERA